MKITLCGSARFEEHFREWTERLTLVGHVVHTLSVYPSFKQGVKAWYSDAQKITLDLIHLAKIEESDAIFVLDVEEYIGESTSREVQWAKIRNKLVYYFSKPAHRDLLLGTFTQ